MGWQNAKMKNMKKMKKKSERQSEEVAILYILECPLHEASTTQRTFLFNSQLS